MPARIKACDRCRQLKIKCDGEEPCARCASAQLECRFRARPKAKPFPVSETPQTHYTISEDAIAATARNMLFAIEAKSDSSQGASVGIPPFSFATDDSSGDDGKGPESSNIPHISNIELAKTIAAQQRQRIAQNQMLTNSDAFEPLRKAARNNQRQSPTYFHKPSSKLDQGQMESDKSVLPSPTIPLAKGTDSTRDRIISEHAGFEGSFTDVWTANSAPPSDASLMQQMKQRIKQLEAENLEYHRREWERSCPTKIQIFHCLADYDDDGAVYLSEPDWEIRGEDIILRGQFPVLDPRGYAERKGNIAFIVYKRYAVEHQRAELDEAIYDKQHLPKPEPASEEIELISDEMVKAVKAFFGLYPTFRTEFPEVDETTTLAAPYIWYYHCRESPVIQNLPSQQTELVTALTSWIEDNYAPLYDQVDDQFRRGKVSKMSFEYLIRPGRVLISTNNGIPRGFVATSRPLLIKPHEIPSEDNEEHEVIRQCSWSIKSRSLAYEGDFYYHDQELTVKLKTEAEDDEVEIASLDVLPLEYASSEVRKRLKRRGKAFWRCRNKYFVSYEETSTDGKQEVCGISLSGFPPAPSTSPAHPN